jgi:hypothetical protein
VYSSLGVIDLVVETPEGPLLLQTDHRSCAEIEAEPEISVLFALARVVASRHAMERDEKVVAEVVYVCFDAPPGFLIDALASVGGALQLGSGGQRRRLDPARETREAILDRALVGLADRVRRRVGLSDPAAALHALEAETLAEPPASDRNAVGYWTRVLELAALGGEVIRLKRPATWVIAEVSEVPFALELDGEQRILLANRAMRFIGDGAHESMFVLLGGLEDATRIAATGEGPILPSLRPREDAVRHSFLWTPLIEAESDAVPVIAYGNDSPTAFGLMTSPDSDGRLDEVRSAALTNIRAQEVEVEVQETGDGEPVAVVTGSFFATEKLLDPVFMRAQARRLGADVLAVGVPRRGLMLVAPVTSPGMLSGMMTLVAHEYEQGGSRAISPLLLVVQDGEVIGLARPSEEPDDSEKGEPPPAVRKRPGFFARLFGRR